MAFTEFRQDGTALIWPASLLVGKRVGDLVRHNYLVGVVRKIEDTVATVAVAGVWSLPKTGRAYELGQKVYIDLNTGAFADDGFPVGVCTRAAAASDEAVEVALNVGTPYN